eukprot:1190287-Prorocentrum_minimum.AAC.6
MAGHNVYTPSGPPLDPLWTPSGPPLDPLWTSSGLPLDPTSPLPGARRTDSRCSRTVYTVVYAGKTIQAISLILANQKPKDQVTKDLKAKAKAPTCSEGKPSLLKIKATLVICPGQ